MAISDFMKGTVKINWKGGQGFQEQYNFDTTIVANATSWLGTICNYRSLLLPLGFEIVWAQVSQLSVQRDSYVPASYFFQPRLLGAESTVEACNNVASGLLYRFTTNGGQWGNRLIRGLRDSWIADYASTIGTPTVYASVGALPTIANGMSVVSAIGGYLSAVKLLTTSMKKIVTPPVPPATVPTISYNNVPWSGWQYQRIADRDVGKGYSMTRGRKRKTV
jgi:hypothetical protein